MNDLVWNVCMMGEIDGRLALAVTSPLVTREMVEDVTGGRMIARVGDGWGTEEQAIEIARALNYDVLYRVVLEAEVIA